jgi:uncharacterized protein involved in exopolysaccharide biosynthesis
VKLVSLGIVARRVATGGELELNAGEIARSVSVGAEGNSDVVAVTATRADPREAARLANLYAAEYVAFRRDADRATIEESADLVRRQLDSLAPEARIQGEGRVLAERVEDLDALAAVQTGNAEVVEGAEPPSSPSAPRPLRDAVSVVRSACCSAFPWPWS